jgi:glutaredoxin
MNKKIEIYSTPSCHFCHMEKDFLTSHNIAFTDHDVAADMEKRKHIIELTGQMGVPVTVITDLDHQISTLIFLLDSVSHYLNKN